MVDTASSSTSSTRHRTSAGKPDLEAAQSLPVKNEETSVEEPLLSGRQIPGQLAVEFAELEAGLTRFWDKFSRKGKKNIAVGASLRAIAFSSWLNLFVVFIPLAWIAHYLPIFSRTLTFAFCFLALIPLEWLFDWGGEQMAFYLGTQLGDLVVITLNNVVEATLAIILLKKCELKLLQSTIVGVVILHLLFIPGVSFIAGGAMVTHQNLHPHMVQLNHSLLMIGVLSLLLPAAFFAALDSGAGTQVTPEVWVGNIVTEHTRDIFLTMSRGTAIILLIVYICSRIFLHNPPGEGFDDEAPTAMIEHEKKLGNKEPKANQWVLIVVLLASIAIMATTTEWLVESIEFVREAGNINDEWFGMFLLPIISWAAHAFVAIVYFIRYMFKHFFKEPAPPGELAKGRAIDLSIQFTLFWMPFMVLLGWWLKKPMSLLFDFFEVAILIGSCFLVNYVTADAKTNWAEGFSLVAFYCLIGLCAWFYDGQPEIRILLGGEVCDNVAEAIAVVASGVVVGAHT